VNTLLFNTTTENLEIVSFLNQHYCPHAQAATNCYELNGSVRRMASTRLLTAKTINCSRADAVGNKCDEYSAISRNMFMSQAANPLMHSVINYFFDLSTQIRPR
jgi:hypothetical protein